MCRKSVGVYMKFSAWVVLVMVGTRWVVRGPAPGIKTYFMCLFGSDSDPEHEQYMTARLQTEGI